MDSWPPQSHKNISLLNHMVSGIAKNHHTIIPVLAYMVFTGMPPSSVKAIPIKSDIFICANILFTYF